MIVIIWSVTVKDDPCGSMTRMRITHDHMSCDPFLFNHQVFQFEGSTQSRRSLVMSDLSKWLQGWCCGWSVVGLDTGSPCGT